ncbi:DUF3231 family protein [Desulfoscipio geothermicus]|uniref:DUF3231 family protein n=1 Tax=Desulfoscipio geothermicus DSM 3669 TaxID=1121426 RepID=A0A1I6DPC1_9FIRM|nr:DUF3231 family protein [Desulfoscipio geothermicus]SFR07208.1 Protein of unknown function [Desulfoscipio geothermicus DSM 3669]
MQFINSFCKNTKEKPHCGEVFCLWQHLAQRYDTLEITQIFQNFAHDNDFKAILTMGLKILNNEIELIEKQMNYFDISVPPRPPKSANTPTNTEILRDEIMFRIIYWGIQNFVIQQTKSILAVEKNHLKSMFIKMLETEINLYDKLTSFGKSKGWLYVPPMCDKRS